MPAKKVIDHSLKVLAKQYPKAFIKLAMGSIENLVFETIENPEINLPERRLDFVYGLQGEEQEYILHLDFQLRHETDIPERMHIYNALLTASNKKPVISKVIYLERELFAMFGGPGSKGTFFLLHRFYAKFCFFGGVHH